MKVLSPRGPWTAAETVALASTFQTIGNLTVEAAGFTLVLEYVCCRKHASYARATNCHRLTPTLKVQIEFLQNVIHNERHHGRHISR